MMKDCVGEEGLFPDKLNNIVRQFCNLKLTGRLSECIHYLHNKSAQRTQHCHALVGPFDVSTNRTGNRNLSCPMLTLFVPFAPLVPFTPLAL